MDIEKTVRSLEKNRYTVSFFESSEEAAEYIDKAIDGRTVGFGDSMTMKSMKLYERLSKHNQVYDPNQSTDNDEFLELAKKCLDTEIYLTSVNAISEAGEMVNIDGTGNRVAGSLFGHEKVYFVVTTNKIEESLEKAVYRARNIAGPKNALKYNLRTPCVIKGDRCYDCASPDRICNTLNIYLKKMNDIDDVEIVLIDEKLGF
ncbi:MAG: lactate utilization protein [Anaerovoracaceae bacterium]|uniref:Lactate utilization protein n=1 Tax=Candidatus Allocopromorpha excrementavium TaxID=2840741 RepID=A0A9D1KVL5_9FIRM|nr:lactate utilization protein [Candidatus Copromorpha excrementavium]